MIRCRGIPMNIQWLLYRGLKPVPELHRWLDAVVFSNPQYLVHLRNREDFFEADSAARPPDSRHRIQGPKRHSLTAIIFRSDLYPENPDL